MAQHAGIGHQHIDGREQRGQYLARPFEARHHAKVAVVGGQHHDALVLSKQSFHTHLGFLRGNGRGFGKTGVSPVQV